jgi:hypothetical protein
MNETRSMIAKLLSPGATDLADDSALGETPGWDSFAQLNIMLELESVTVLQSSTKPSALTAIWRQLTILQRKEADRVNQAEANQFNTRWETDISAHGRQLNRYPYPAFIGPFLLLFGRAPDRGKRPRSRLRRRQQYLLLCPRGFRNT